MSVTVTPARFIFAMFLLGDLRAPISKCCERFAVEDPCVSRMSLSWPVGLYIDLTPLHSCMFVSLVTELLCALNHSSDAFALAQGCHKKELHLSW